MLRINQNVTPAGAKSYYTTSDYYSEGQELAGTWHGKGAERLGLSGEIAKAAWDALCDNRHPATGETLTIRRKDYRSVGYDFNYHVPKSASILYGLTRDGRLLEAFRDSVNATMSDMEAEMKTRVRVGGRNEDRTTGNMAWGEFVHFTARPVDGVPDPHLHAHCFVFNTTWDGEESRWKAGQFRDLKRDAPYFEAVFHTRLARRMEELGLPVERTRKGWEIAGLTAETLAKFSRRTALIEDIAKEKGITDAEAKGELGAKTREKKQKGLSAGELRREWESRLTTKEMDDMSRIGERLGSASIAEDPALCREAVDRAVGHLFERSSVVAERRLLAEALKRSVAAAAETTVFREVNGRGLLTAERDGRRQVTTPAVLEEERRMIAFARDGRGACRKLGGDGEHEFRNKNLARGQVAAVLHVLNSPDRVMLIRGPAGSGKTKMMREAVDAVEAQGTRVFTFTPSSEASSVLHGEGFANATTVAWLLQDERLQNKVKGSVLWIDESGLLGSKTMGEVFDLASRLGCRIVLSGDRAQHGSVERGAALRLLEEEAGLVPADLREIRRQEGDYRRAVQALSEGRTEAGFRQLDELGWIKEVPDEERYAILADDYVETICAGKTALVVCPTHREGDQKVTPAIRSRLKEAGRLGENERTVASLVNLNLTEAERRDALNYAPGDVLVFHQNAKGFKKGERLLVAARPLPLEEAAKFQVFRRGEIDVAKGDLMRVTRNGPTADGKHRLNNGARYTVKGFTAKGDLVLDNGWTVARDFGHLAYGYVVTSHAAQGQTVKRVLIAQSAESFPASSREQFYVSVSRGRERATLYTADKEALLEAVRRSDDRLSATELVHDRDRQQAIVRARHEELRDAAISSAVSETREREELAYGG